MDSEVPLVETIPNHAAAGELRASKVSSGEMQKIFGFINCKVQNRF